MFDSERERERGKHIKFNIMLYCIYFSLKVADSTTVSSPQVQTAAAVLTAAGGSVFGAEFIKLLKKIVLVAVNSDD